MSAPVVVHVTLPGDRPPWTPTGLAVEAGDAVTLLGSGFIRWSPHRDIGAGAKFHLWGRVAGGETFGCTQDTTTVTVDRAGELELCVYKGAWADRSGRLATGDEPYRRNDGALAVTVIHWRQGTDPLVGLEGLDDPAVDQRLVDAEGERLRHPVTPPERWAYLLDFGTTDILGDPPSAIVAVWLIAVSHFSRGTGRATFSDIALTTGGHRMQVL